MTSEDLTHASVRQKFVYFLVAEQNFCSDVAWEGNYVRDWGTHLDHKLWLIGENIDNPVHVMVKISVNNARHDGPFALLFPQNGQCHT